MTRKTLWKFLVELGNVQRNFLWTLDEVTNQLTDNHCTVDKHKEITKDLFTGFVEGDGVPSPSLPFPQLSFYIFKCVPVVMSFF